MRGGARRRGARVRRLRRRLRSRRLGGGRVGGLDGTLLRGCFLSLSVAFFFIFLFLSILTKRHEGLVRIGGISVLCHVGYVRKKVVKMKKKVKLNSLKLFYITSEVTLMRGSPLPIWAKGHMIGLLFSIWNNIHTSNKITKPDAPSILWLCRMIPIQDQNMRECVDLDGPKSPGLFSVPSSRSNYDRARLAGFQSPVLL